MKRQSELSESRCRGDGSAAKHRTVAPKFPRRLRAQRIRRSLGLLVSMWNFIWLAAQYRRTSKRNRGSLAITSAAQTRSYVISHLDSASRRTVAGAKFEAVALSVIVPAADARRIAKQRPCHA